MSKIPKNWKPFDKYRIIRADQSATDSARKTPIQSFQKLNSKPIFISEYDAKIQNDQTANTNIVLVPSESELKAKGNWFEVIEPQAKKPGRPKKEDV